MTSGDHRPPANWKEDARLAWKFVSVLTTITSIALVVAGWGFSSWKDSNTQAIARIESSNQAAIGRIEKGLEDFKSQLSINSQAQLNRYLEHDRRLTALETKVRGYHGSDQ